MWKLWRAKIKEIHHLNIYLLKVVILNIMYHLQILLKELMSCLLKREVNLQKKMAASKNKEQKFF